MTERPLFIPLKREYFEAFKSGTKDTEFRLPFGRWNARTCRTGRAVVLSLGYGKAHRLNGWVAGFYHAELTPESYKAFAACYPGAPNLAACIPISFKRPQ